MVPDKLPLQPLALATKPEPGVTVKVVVPPLLTVLELGLMVPPDPPPVLDTM